MNTKEKEKEKLKKKKSIDDSTNASSSSFKKFGDQESRKPKEETQPTIKIEKLPAAVETKDDSTSKLQPKPKVKMKDLTLQEAAESPPQTSLLKQKSIKKEDDILIKDIVAGEITKQKQLSVSLQAAPDITKKKSSDKHKQKIKEVGASSDKLTTTTATITTAPKKETHIKHHDTVDIKTAITKEEKHSEKLKKKEKKHTLHRLKGFLDSESSESGDEEPLAKTQKDSKSIEKETGHKPNLDVNKLKLMVEDAVEKVKPEKLKTKEHSINKGQDKDTPGTSQQKSTSVLSQFGGDIQKQVIPATGKDALHVKREEHCHPPDHELNEHERKRREEKAEKKRKKEKKREKERQLAMGVAAVSVEGGVAIKTSHSGNIGSTKKIKAGHEDPGKKTSEGSETKHKKSKSKDELKNKVFTNICEDSIATTKKDTTRKEDLVDELNVSTKKSSIDISEGKHSHESIKHKRSKSGDNLIPKVEAAHSSTTSKDVNIPSGTGQPMTESPTLNKKKEKPVNTLLESIDDTAPLPALKPSHQHDVKKEKVSKKDTAWKSVDITLFGEQRVTPEKPHHHHHHHKASKEEKEKLKHKKKHSHEHKHKTSKTATEPPVTNLPKELIKEAPISHADKAPEIKQHKLLGERKSDAESKLLSQTSSSKHSEAIIKSEKHKEKSKEKKVKSEIPENTQLSKSLITTTTTTLTTDTVTTPLVVVSTAMASSSKKIEQENCFSGDLLTSASSFKSKRLMDSDFERRFKAFCDESQRDVIKPAVSPIRPALSGLLDSLGSKESARNLSKGIVPKQNNDDKDSSKSKGNSKETKPLDIESNWNISTQSSGPPLKREQSFSIDTDQEVKKKHKRSTEADLQVNKMVESLPPPLKTGKKRIHLSDSDSGSSDEDFTNNSSKTPNKIRKKTEGPSVSPFMMPGFLRSLDDPLQLKQRKESSTEGKPEPPQPQLLKKENDDEQLPKEKPKVDNVTLPTTSAPAKQKHVKQTRDENSKVASKGTGNLTDQQQSVKKPTKEKDSSRKMAAIKEVDFNKKLGFNSSLSNLEPIKKKKKKRISESRESFENKLQAGASNSKPQEYPPLAPVGFSSAKQPIKQQKSIDKADTTKQVHKMSFKKGDNLSSTKPTESQQLLSSKASVTPVPSTNIIDTKEKILAPSPPFEINKEQKPEEIVKNFLPATATVGNKKVEVKKDVSLKSENENAVESLLSITENSSEMYGKVTSQRLDSLNESLLERKDDNVIISPKIEEQTYDDAEMAAATNLLELEAEDDKEEDFDPFTRPLNQQKQQQQQQQQYPSHLMKGSLSTKRKSSSDVEQESAFTSTTASITTSTVVTTNTTAIFNITSSIVETKVQRSDRSEEIKTDPDKDLLRNLLPSVATVPTMVSSVETIVSASTASSPSPYFTTTPSSSTPEASQVSPSRSLAYLMSQTPTHPGVQDQDIIATGSDNVLEKAQNALFAALGNTEYQSNTEVFQQPPSSTYHDQLVHQQQKEQKSEQSSQPTIPEQQQQKQETLVDASPQTHLQQLPFTPQQMHQHAQQPHLSQQTHSHMPPHTVAFPPPPGQILQQPQQLPQGVFPIIKDPGQHQMFLQYQQPQWQAYQQQQQHPQHAMIGQALPPNYHQRLHSPTASQQIPQNLQSLYQQPTFNPEAFKQNIPGHQLHSGMYPPISGHPPPRSYTRHGIEEYNLKQQQVQKSLEEHRLKMMQQQQSPRQLPPFTMQSKQPPHQQHILHAMQQGFPFNFQQPIQPGQQIPLSPPTQPGIHRHNVASPFSPTASQPKKDHHPQESSPLSPQPLQLKDPPNRIQEVSQGGDVEQPSSTPVRRIVAQPISLPAPAVTKSNENKLVAEPQQILTKQPLQLQSGQHIGQDVLQYKQQLVTPTSKMMAEKVEDKKPIAVIMSPQEGQLPHLNVADDKSSQQQLFAQSSTTQQHHTPTVIGYQQYEIPQIKIHPTSPPPSSQSLISPTISMQKPSEYQQYQQHQTQHQQQQLLRQQQQQLQKHPSQQQQQQQTQQLQQKQPSQQSHQHHEQHPPQQQQHQPTPLRPPVSNQQQQQQQQHQPTPLRPPLSNQQQQQQQQQHQRQQHQSTPLRPPISNQQQQKRQRQQQHLQRLKQHETHGSEIPQPQIVQSKNTNVPQSQSTTLTDSVSSESSKSVIISVVHSDASSKQLPDSIQQISAPYTPHLESVQDSDSSIEKPTSLGDNMKQDKVVKLPVTPQKIVRPQTTAPELKEAIEEPLTTKKRQEASTEVAQSDKVQSIETKIVTPIVTRESADKDKQQTVVVSEVKSSPKNVAGIIANTDQTEEIDEDMKETEEFGKELGKSPKEEVVKEQINESSEIEQHTVISAPVAPTGIDEINTNMPPMKQYEFAGLISPHLTSSVVTHDLESIDTSDLLKTEKQDHDDATDLLSNSNSSLTLAKELQTMPDRDRSDPSISQVVDCILQITDDSPFHEETNSGHSDAGSLVQSSSVGGVITSSAVPMDTASIYRHLKETDSYLSQATPEELQYIVNSQMINDLLPGEGYRADASSGYLPGDNQQQLQQQDQQQHDPATTKNLSEPLFISTVAQRLSSSEEKLYSPKHRKNEQRKVDIEPGALFRGLVLDLPPIPDPLAIPPPTQAPSVVSKPPVKKQTDPPAPAPTSTKTQPQIVDSSTATDIDEKDGLVETESTEPSLKSWREAVAMRCAQVKPVIEPSKTKLEELFNTVAAKLDYNELMEKVGL